MAHLNEVLTGLFDVQGIRRSLRSARIPMAPERYLGITLAATAASTTLYLAFLSWLYFNNLQIRLFGVIPDFIAKLVLFALMVPGVYVAFSTYPGLVAQGRKSKIDLDLPYAVSYMEALSTTMTLYDVIRRVFEEIDLFGEVSREFGMIVRDVELFGEDLYSAIQNLQKITPSEVMKDFLDDLMLLSRSGGDLTAFLGAKSSFFRDSSNREMDMVLKTIEVMAEVYVTAFVAGPIAIIIMVVAQNLSGTSTLTEWMPLVYIGIPAGALAMIWLLYILLPRENLTISRQKFYENEYGGGVSTTGDITEIDERLLKRIRVMKKQQQLQKLLKHPFRHFISDYNIGAVIGMAGVLVVFLLYFTGELANLFPVYTTEIFVCLCAIVLMAPLSLAYEGRRWFVNKVEEQMPEFLRELADMKEIGMTLQGAIRMISTSKLGLLNHELSLVSEEIKRGSSINNALVHMEQRLGMVSVKRAISLVVKASEVTDYLKDILTIAITDFEHYLKLKKERFNVSFVYVMIVYLSFGIYLYTAYQLNVSFIASFQSFESINLTSSVASNIQDMLWIGILLGGFSGIMAGQLSSANPMAGFKHSIIFLIVTIALFLWMESGTILGVVL